MLSQAKSFFGTLAFAHVGIALFSFALQASAIYNWLEAHPFWYWLIYGALALGYLWISVQESINQGGRDAQKLQGCLDRGDGEEACKKAYQPWYGLVYAAVLEAPVMLLSLVAACLKDLPATLVGLIPTFWYSGYMPIRDVAPGAFPWLYLAFALLHIALPALVYPEGRRRQELMHAHMLENTERIRSRQKPIRIPRGK